MLPHLLELHFVILLGTLSNISHYRKLCVSLSGVEGEAYEIDVASRCGFDDSCKCACFLLL